MLALLVGLLALTASCATLGAWRHRPPIRCADGLPPRIFMHVACPPDGICGYTCEPDRWATCEDC